MSISPRTQTKINLVQSQTNLISSPGEKPRYSIKISYKKFSILKEGYTEDELQSKHDIILRQVLKQAGIEYSDWQQSRNITAMREWD